MANTFFFRPMRRKRQQLSEQECLAILNNATTGTSARYGAADVWKDFTNIVEDDDPLGIGESVQGEAIEIARYNIHGQRIYAPKPGVNIIKYDDGTTKKVLVK